jgi:hypothetical protein
VNAITRKPAEKRQGFGHWYWIVFRYCPNGHEMAIRAGNTKRFGAERGPSLPPGGTICHCGERITF